MRCVIVSTEFPPGPGGIGMHAFQLANHLAKRGHTVTAIVVQDYAPNREIIAFNAAQRFEVVRLAREGSSLRKGSVRLRQIMECVWSPRPDVVLGSGKRAVWLASIASTIAHVPFVAVGHGTEFQSLNIMDRFATRHAFGHASGVVSVSQFTQGLMLDLDIHPARSWVIHNGADESRFRRLPSDEIDRFSRNLLGRNGCSIITTVGSLTERKGQHIVIQALPSVLERVPDVHYVLAGMPTKREKYVELSKALGVADHVHCLGRTPAEDIVRLLNASDLFIMTSTRTASGDVEGFGIAVVEAALCGVPAVVSRESGLIEAIEDGLTGVAVPEDDVDATARAITMLLTDASKRRRMGEAARRRAENAQTWKRVAGDFEDVFNTITNKA